MNKYIKYGLTALACVSLSTGALAAVGMKPIPPAPVSHYFQGPYIGVGAGVVDARAYTKSYAYATKDGFSEEPGFYTYLDDASSSKHGINGHALVGFGQTVNSSYYWGIEAFGHYFDCEIERKSYDMATLKEGGPTTKASLHEIQIESPYSVGGDIRLGYLILPRVMAYALIGVDYARFKVKENYNFWWESNMGRDFDEWEWGIMPGIGVEIGVMDNVSVRAQYTHTFYSSFSHEAVVPSLLYPQKEQKYHLNTKVEPDRELATLTLSLLIN